MRWTRRVAFLAGLALAAVAVAGWQIEPAGGTPGLDLRMIANSSGELELAPNGQVLTASEMRPGNEVSATLTARNLTGMPLEFHLRAIPASEDLDEMLAVRATASGRSVYDGTLGELREWSDRGFSVAPAQTESIELTASLDGSTGETYLSQGRGTRVVLELASEEAGAR